MMFFFPMIVNPWDDQYVYLRIHEFVGDLFMVNVGTYGIHGSYGFDIGDEDFP